MGMPMLLDPDELENSVSRADSREQLNCLCGRNYDAMMTSCLIHTVRPTFCGIANSEVGTLFRQ